MGGGRAMICDICQYRKIPINSIIWHFWWFSNPEICEFPDLRDFHRIFVLKTAILAVFGSKMALFGHFGCFLVKNGHFGCFLPKNGHFGSFLCVLGCFFDANSYFARFVNCLKKVFHIKNQHFQKLLISENGDVYFPQNKEYA